VKEQKGKIIIYYLEQQIPETTKAKKNKIGQWQNQIWNNFQIYSFSELHIKIV
jgi:hypothetical protein